MHQWLELMSGLHDIAERGLGLMSNKPPEMRERLQEAHDLFSYIEEHFPPLLNELESQREVK
jgi:FMN phosphatase YigB (HAD superfamily)